MSERGASESLQWSLLVPILMSLVLGIIQLGLWLHGREVASHAALTAAEEVAWGRADLAQASAAGARIAVAGGLVESSVAIERTGTEVRVRLTGRVPLFFDVGQGLISELAVLPVEAVRRP